MDIQVDITENFEKGFKKLTEDVQDVLTKKINLLIRQLQIGNTSKLYRTKNLVFPEGFDKKKSTLYIFKATPKFRVILSLDNNPLQDNKIMTLYNITDHDNMAYCFMIVAKKLYK